MKNHYFFAVKLPAATKQFLRNWVDENKKRFPFLKWVHHEDYHITLAFLGFAEEEKLNCAIHKIRQLCSTRNAFQLTLYNIGIFGSRKAPRIFWANTKESDELNDLQKNAYELVTSCGFELDKKPFRPHITLARKWDQTFPFLEDSLPSLAQENHTFNVEKIVLYKTNMNSIPKYEVVESFHLN